MKSRKTKILLRSIIAILLVVVIALIAASFYFLNYALTPYRRSHDEAMERFYKREPVSLKVWVDSLESNHCLRDTSITIDGRGKMAAIYLRAEQPNNRVALLLHGYNDRAESMLHIAYIYNHEMGFSADNRRILEAAEIRVLDNEFVRAGSFTVGGIWVSTYGTTITMTVDGQAVLSVKDDYGNTATDTVSYEVYDYWDPALAEFSIRRCKQDGTPDDTAGYCKITYHEGKPNFLFLEATAGDRRTFRDAISLGL